MTRQLTEEKAYEKLGIKGSLVDNIPYEFEIEAALEMDQQAQFHPVTFLHHVLESINTDKVKIDEQSLVEDVTQKDDESITFAMENGKLHYLDIACTHLGCDLNWNKGDATWDYPCHGSSFHASGEVHAGPALKDLTKKY